MKKYTLRFLVCAVAVCAVVFAVSIVIDGRPEGKAVVEPIAAPADTVSVSPLSDGDDEVIENKAAGYSFTMPTNWYLEKSSGADMTLYPDYDPASGDTAACKIEISALAATATDLSTWITEYLHADPTADIFETSQMPITIGSSSAIEWRGSLNNVSTTLVYATAPNGNIIEFAPSTLAANGDPDADDCTLELQGLLAGVTFAAATN